MEWVEVEGKTVAVAVRAGLEELGIESADEAEVEVLKEPERGFLGFGGSMALVRIKPKPKKKRRRRGGRRRGSGGADEGSGSQRRDEGRGDSDRRDRGRSGDRGGRQREGGGQREGGDRERGRDRKGGAREGRQGRDGRGQGESSGRRGGRRPRESQQATGEKSRDRGGDRNRGSQQKGEPAMNEEATPVVDVEAQADIVREFLVGLLDAFGLDGDVDMRVDEGIVFADVTGEQTEALVGTRGVILQSILELCRTVVQRKSHSSVRIRLDIAGYTERRRAALRIYAARLADQVLRDGEEVSLEPMNPADRKVVHDAVADIDDVRTYSEGEEPNRSVVIGLAPGATPTGEEERAPAGDPSEEDPSEEDPVEDESGDGDVTDDDSRDDRSEDTESDDDGVDEALDDDDAEGGGPAADEPVEAAAEDDEPAS